MLKKIGLLVLALAVMACAGVIYGRSRGAMIPGLPDPPLTTALDAPIRSGDSTVLADFARDRCRLLWGDQRKSCYEEILLGTVERGEVHLAMTALGILDRTDPSLRRAGHDYTHVVGINAWSPGKDVSKVFADCTELYQSGCYHGVIQAYLDANGTDSAVVSSVCNQIEAARGTPWLRFQCVHGLGHGLVQNMAMHLPKALAGCDWLASRWDQESCYGGAFMEFIVGGRGQSHHPHSKRWPKTGEAHGADSTGHGEHAEHMAHASPNAPPDSFKVRDRSDLLYPCSVLADKYLRSCYGMQAGLIIEVVGADFGEIGRACDHAPERLRPACYQGIGTYVSGFTTRDPVRADNFCSLGNPRYRAWCYVGVVKNFIDVTSKADDGIEFCSRLKDRRIAVACYVAVGEELSVLVPKIDAREVECRKVSAEFLSACRYGAVLGAPRPAELTPTS